MNLEVHSLCPISRALSIFKLFTATSDSRPGIDYAFLEALPEELRAEVLEMHGAQVEPEAPPPPAAASAQLPPAAATTAAGVAAVPAATASAAGGVPGAGSTVRPAASTAAPSAAAGGSSAATDSGLDGLDPEFLAALPPDIRQEVLAQQVG